jgi:hypothetical protein
MRAAKMLRICRIYKINRIKCRKRLILLHSENRLCKDKMTDYKAIRSLKTF